MDLRCKYKIGRSNRCVEINSKKDRVYHTYEFTVVTPEGEFKESEWIQLIEKQARDRFETNTLKKLTEYSLKELAWINTEKEAYEYALNLYSNRIWENKEWLGYDEFNMKPNENNNAEQISLF